MKREELFFALSETTHARRFTESAAKRFICDVTELETGSRTGTSVAYINNQLSDARESLLAAEGEISLLIHDATE